MLTIDLHPSRTLALASWVLRLLILLGLALTALPVSYRIALALVVLASLAWSARQTLIRLRCTTEGVLYRLADEEWVALELLPDTFVTPWLTLIRHLPPGRPWPEAIVVLPDSLPPDDYRRLRVWLKWQARFAGKPTPDRSTEPSTGS